ncbi:hypothetical protein, conserved [Leishmania tarentolae]|uniref:Ankyrin repeat protein n=1 Tax=Leishmania tarentolae TaxID=5689 RepID=A0A640KEY4_LEITA|nr:hypothetical protein, conserved [Leishmania tarentolae]
MYTPLEADVRLETAPAVALPESSIVRCTPQRPFNETLQAEAAAYLHEREADVSVELSKGDPNSSAKQRENPLVPPGLLIELREGEQVDPSLPRPENLNLCTCTTAVFDAWLRAVVRSISVAADPAASMQRGNSCGSRTIHGRAKSDSMAGASRQKALYRALEMLEAAARLLQRHTVLCRDRSRLLLAYYGALEEDIQQHATASSASPAEKETAHLTAGAQLHQLLPPEQHKFSPFHYQLRMYKRDAPLQHYTHEKAKLQSRLEKVYYVLVKLEEVEGLSNSILVEGQATSLPSQQKQNTADLPDGDTKAGSMMRIGLGKNGIDAGTRTDAHGALTLSCGSGAREDGLREPKLHGPASQFSRQLVGMEQRVRRLRHQLRLPLPASEVTSRLRNELILSFSARILALRESAPFTSEIYATSTAPAASSSRQVALQPHGDAMHHQSSHSISAFVEWYVQRVMDPLAISQLLSIVPREYVVTTTCRLVYACETHASLRSSRALPDLGPVLLRAVAEGRSDAVAQLLLSSSVSYGSVLSHPVDCHTCFFAGLLGGQLDVLTRLVEQQSWHVNALHMLLFMSAPWNIAAAPTVVMPSRGCHVYQQALVERVQAFLSVAEQILAARSHEPTYKLPLALEESVMGATGMGTSAGGADKETDELALAALRKAQLLDMSTEGEKLIASLGCFLGSAASSDPTFDEALSGGRHSSGRSVHIRKTITTADTPVALGSGIKKASDASSTGDDDITDSAGVLTLGAPSMLSASRGGPALPPLFLNGALHRLQLFLAVRNAMLQYERLRHDSRWEALLGKVKARTGSGDDTSAAATNTAHGLGSSSKNLVCMHAKTPSPLQGVASANDRANHREAPPSSALTPPSSFAHVLHQNRLDGLTAVAVCPLRCQMCPAFTTPQLQRVDAWSYGPLQPTAAITTALSTARDTSSEGAAEQSSRDLISLIAPVKPQILTEEDDGYLNENLYDRHDRSLNSLCSHSQPIAALLMRSDTAIDMTAGWWLAHSIKNEANFAEEYVRYGHNNSSSSSSSSNRAPNTIDGNSRKCNAEGQAAHGTCLHRLVNPWQVCVATSLLVTSLPFRYSLSVPLEEVRRAEQDAKQRRALRILYGSSVGREGEKSNSDNEDDGDAWDDHHPLCSGAGTVGERPATFYVHRPPPPRATPSFYYEVQISVEYLVAMYTADCLEATTHAIGSEVLAQNASRPLSEDAMYRRCANCVVVGLCNPITAAQANGCTHSPSPPYVVTHLGHECGTGDKDEDGGRGRSGEGGWSAGVSVSVIAHEKGTASRLLSTGATADPVPGAAVAEPGEASTAQSDDDADVDVLYLCVWKHQHSTVRAIKAMKAPLHRLDADAADAWISTSPVYLRLELPRWLQGAPAKEAETTTATDTPPDRVATVNGNSANAAATAATASTNVWLPIITRACREDVARAVAKAQQKQAEAAQTVVANKVGEHARESRRGAASSSASPLASLPRVRCEVPATLVLGLLLDPSADTLRLRLNNYVDFEEITLGLRLGGAADDTSTTASAPHTPPVPQPRLYPAATLSLNDCGWRSWCEHQTRKWLKQQQQGVSPTGLTSGKENGGRTQIEYSAPPSSTSLSNAVIRFNFDAAELLFMPPPPHQAAKMMPAGAMVSATKTARTPPHQQQQQQRMREPVTTKTPPSVVPPYGMLQHIALLDSTVKFKEMLSVLTNVSLLAATKQSGGKNQQPLSSIVHSNDAAVEDEVNGVHATIPRGAAPQAHSSLLLVGSHDSRAHAAMMRVHSLLNTPGGGVTGTAAGNSSVFNNSDPADVFYPPVRIYRHSCHCPPRELYPLSSSSWSDAADKDNTERRSRRTQQPQRPLGNRRMGLGGAGEGSSLFSSNLYWHDIVPENARLTPLCAALASRQRTMAYAIAVHPLTCFCNLSADPDSASAAYVQQQQSQQRRTALYAACALGYMEVVQVLLERIPVEELLSYFGLVIQSEARATLQRCYAMANAAFLRKYRLRSLVTQSSSSLNGADQVNSSSENCSITTRSTLNSRNGTTTMTLAAHARKSGDAAAATSPSAAPYLSNESQRALLDVSAIYSSSRSTYTPLHVALLGVVLDNGDQDDEGVDEGSYVDVNTEEACMSLLSARLSKQTACATVLLNCLYDLLCVASVSNAATCKARSAAEPVYPPNSIKSYGRAEDMLKDDAQARRSSLAGRELFVDALNLQSPAGEAALLIAVRHNNVAVALRLLKMGAQPACMDRVTKLLSLELACANRCTPIAEALLQSHNGGGAVYAMSPVLLNHAGIATALCWCAINNMPATMQRLLECDGIDVESGFEGSSPLHLAIAFGSEAAALALLSGTQPRKRAAICPRKGGGSKSETPSAVPVAAGSAAPVTTAASFAAKHVNLDSSQRGATAQSASGAQPREAVSAAKAHKKPFMDVNILHERTHCTPLHLACERGQLSIIRTLLQGWHAQLNIAAAYTNYTPLLTALAHGQEEAALRILEHSKDELRRGRAVLDLCAIDQHGNTALHLAASRGMALALEYMLVQFSEEELARLAALHPTLRASPAYKTTTCMVPLHAVNKQGKTALLTAVQYGQAGTAELLVSMLIDGVETQAVGSSATAFGGGVGSKSSTRVADGGEASLRTSDKAAASTSSHIGGPLIEGTCMALYQAHRKHLDSVVELMLSAPPSLFPCTAEFRKSVQLYKQHQADGRRSVVLKMESADDDDVRPAFIRDDNSSQVPVSKRNENASEQTPAMALDRGSFVRLLLTRAAGTTISPSDALTVLLRGFALPELCVYLSDVAAESAALGVQRSTAMAHADLLIGYLQEHAESVVAPARAVVFCRGVWVCLQQWLSSEAPAEHERMAVSRTHHGLFSGTMDPTSLQFSVGTENSSEHGQKQQQQNEFEESSMGWLCRVLIASKPDAGSHPHGNAALPKSALPANASSPPALSADSSGAAQEVEHYRHALEEALNRKTLSLEVARMIRLYGRSHGGARAIEEIKSIVATYVRTHANAPAAQVRLSTMATTTAAVSSTPTWNGDGTPGLDAKGRAVPDRNGVHIIGNEELFTTPMGFTVLQLAITLSLPEVVTFLVDTYKLNPLYAPAQAMHSCGAPSDAPPLQQANCSKEGIREEKAARVRHVVAHAVRAMVRAATRCAGHADYGEAHGSAGKSREENGLWICWSPYRLAVRSGHLHIVKTLLLAGSSATPVAPTSAEIDPQELCGTSASARFLDSDGRVKGGVAVGSAGATVSTATSPSALVDYKEPAWLDPYQRTALQESIVVVTTCGSDSLVDSLTSGTSTGLWSSSAVAKTSPSPSEALALVRLLLEHGAQPNGLFDSTGSDAWLLAVAGSGASDLPITHHSPDSDASFSLLSLAGATASASTSLTLFRTTAGEAAGKRCVDLLLRYRAPLLRCAPAKLCRADTPLDDKRLIGPQDSAESECFNEQLLCHSRLLLYQWRRLPCMRLVPTRSSAVGSVRRGRRLGDTAGDVHDGSDNDEVNDAAVKDGDDTDRHRYSVFEQADALCSQYAKAQQSLYPSTAMGMPHGGGEVKPSSSSPQATVLSTAVSFESLSSLTSAERESSLPSNMAVEGAVTSHRRALKGRCVSVPDIPVEREAETTPLAPSLSAESLRTQLIKALRLCYGVVFLYTCVEYTPLQLLQLVRAFGAAAIPVSARHPLSSDSVATRLLRKTLAHLLARTSGSGGGNGGGGITSNSPHRAPENDAASIIIGDANDMSELTMSALKDTPCTDDPAADPETRALVGACVGLVHMLRDAALRQPSLPSAPQPQAANTAAGHALRSILFQPSYDGETALSLAARIAHAPLISVLVQSGAAVSPDSHICSRGGDESWRSHGSESGSGIEDGAVAYDISGLPITSNCSLRTNLVDVVVRMLLATRVYYPAQDIGTIYALLAHMPSEPARRAFLRAVYPNIHPLPALQLAIDNVSVASDFLTSPDGMNALWTNLLYAHFTGQLDTTVRATAKVWSDLLHAVLPGAPAVPVYLVMCTAVREELNAEELKASCSGVPAQSTQVMPSQLQSLASSSISLRAVKKRPKERPMSSTISNWAHVVRLTNLFLQLMAMSAAETLMSKSSKPSAYVSAAATTLPSITTAGAGSGQPAPHGLSGTLLWDIIELAVRYDDKDMLRHLLQLRLPDIVLKSISNLQCQQQALSSTITLRKTYSSMGVSARAMETASVAILGSYPSFAGVSTTAQATLVLERLQRLLWWEAVQELHVDLLAVAAGSVSTLRFLYTSSPPDVRAQMAPMRYDRVDIKSGMPEGVSPTPDIVAPAAEGSTAAEELLETFPKVKKSTHEGIGCGAMSQSPKVFALSSKAQTKTTAVHQRPNNSFSASAASATPSANGVAGQVASTPETLIPSLLPAVKLVPSSLAGTLDTPSERSLTLPLEDAPQLQPKEKEDKAESAAAVVYAELRFMESCVQNGRRRLAGGEEGRRCVTAVTWGLGAAACKVRLKTVQSSTRSVSPSTEVTSEVSTTPGARVEVQQRRTSTLHPLPRPSSQRRTALNGNIGGVGSVKGSRMTITAAESTAAQRVGQRGEQTRSASLTKASAVAKEANRMVPSSSVPQDAVAPEPVYFMYLQLDWALHATCQLRSPRPSSGTLETVLFLLDQRVALSVPVLDLFLAGTVAPGNVAAAASQKPSSNADVQQERAINLRYQTRAHGDTLLHLLVLHDQCQLAEYYLEYCHFWFVSNKLDPQPVSRRPGRFPIDWSAAPSDFDSSDDDLNNDNAHLGSGGGFISHDEQKRSTCVSEPLPQRSGGSSSRYARNMPREFLRCMLRVNAHGLTAFDYAHTPAMLQLLEWYGCVPPTYRPNPRTFRRAVFLSHGRHSDVREAYTFADNMDDYDSDEAAHQRKTSSGRASTVAPRKREVLRFFPVPRLVLATDNFLALMDPTGTELVSTVGSVTSAQAYTTPSGTANRKSHNKGSAVNQSLAKGEVPASDRTQPLQVSDRRIDAMISTERRQLQANWKRHQQQERAKALLFEQVAAQSQALVTRQGRTGSGAGESGRDGTLPYLTRTVTAHRRQQWELQRHPPCNEMTLWHNALQAQKLSASALTGEPSRGQLKRRIKGGARGSDGKGAGILPILLSEEVSLLHLGLCSFEDELVRLYGELHTASAFAPAAGKGNTNGDEVRADGHENDTVSVLGAYSRLLLPPSVTDTPTTPTQQDHEEPRRSSGVLARDVPPEMSNTITIPNTKASHTGRTVLPGISSLGGSIRNAFSSAQQGSQLSSTSPTNGISRTSQDFISRGRSLTPPPPLSQMDVVFLLECQQFVVYPLSMPSAGDTAEVVNDGSDGTHSESRKPRSSARGSGGLSMAIGNVSPAPSNDEGSGADPHPPLGKGVFGVSELPAVVERCTGGRIGTEAQRAKGPDRGASRQRAPAPAATGRDIAGSSLAPPHKSVARRERAGGTRDVPPSDLAFLRLFLARNAMDNLSSELMDVSAHRHEAALLVSLTPMLLSGISGDGAGGTCMSAASTMRNLVVKLMDTRWKQFGSRTIISDTNANAAPTSTESVALLNVPPFTLAETQALCAHPAPFSTPPVVGEHGTATPMAALDSAAARGPISMAARLEEWVARRWPLQGQAPPFSKRHVDGERAGPAASQKPPRRKIKSHIPEEVGENKTDRDNADDSGYDDDAVAPSVLDQIEPVGGVSTAAQQVLMRALLKRFAAATGAQLSEQMGLVITPNYDVVEVGDTAAALRDMEARVAAPAAAQKKH